MILGCTAGLTQSHSPLRTALMRKIGVSMGGGETAWTRKKPKPIEVDLLGAVRRPPRRLQEKNENVR